MTDFVTINGMDTREIGVFCTFLPPPSIASERVSNIPVPGRSGYLHRSEDSFETAAKKAGFFFDGINVERVKELFRTASMVVFSNEPDKVYSCRVSNASEFTNQMFDLNEFEIIFECDPEKREREPSIIQAVNGMTLIHPGNRKTKPTFEITGAGTIILTAGSQTVTLQNASGTTIIDGNLEECYTSLGVSANSKMTGSFPILMPGIPTVISWTGTVSAVKILPNWRWV